MALLDGDLRRWLLTRTAVRDLVGARIHKDHLPQKPEFPAIVASLVSTVPVTSHDGFSALRMRRVQLDIYSDEHDEVDALGEAVFAELEGFEGPMFATPVRHSRMLAERDLHEDGLEVDERLYRRSQDWEFAETVP